MLFTKLPVTIADDTLPVVPSSDIDLLLDYEEDALEHWVFDSGNASLVGRTNQINLEIEGTAPSFQPNYASVNTDFPNALVTPFADRPSATYMAIVQVPTLDTDISIFMGNLEESPVLTGSSLYFPRGTPALYHNVRGIAPSDFGLTNADYLSPGDWVFIAASYRSDGANSNSAINLFVGGNNNHIATEFTSFTGDKALDDNTWVIGNNTYDASNTDASPALNIAEAHFYDRWISTNEIYAYYQRAKERAARLGINLVQVPE